MDYISKHISSLLALIVTIGYIVMIVTCTVLKVDVSYFDQFSLVEMAVISYYFGSSNKKNGDKEP